MKSVPESNKPLVKVMCFVISVGFLLCLMFTPLHTPAQAKIDNKPKNLVPPPISVLSKDDKKKLHVIKKFKTRTKLAIAFMNTRLTKSESFTDKGNYASALKQLGRFDAILRDTLTYLTQNQHQKSAVKNLKRFEISLRKFTPRLELVRRETPDKYGYHVKQLVKSVRKARMKAIEPLFGDTVLSKER